MAETYQGRVCKYGHNDGDGFSVRDKWGACIKCNHLRNISDKKRIYNQARSLQRNYGITWEDKMTMFSEQDGKCKVCGKKWESITRDVHVDHCHRHNVVRGLLCYRCNVNLGNLEAYMYNLDGTKSAINKYLLEGMGKCG